jgi:hypothetical protein
MIRTDLNYGNQRAGLAEPTGPLRAGNRYRRGGLRRNALDGGDPQVRRLDAGRRYTAWRLTSMTSSKTVSPISAIGIRVLRMPALFTEVVELAGSRWPRPLPEHGLQSGQASPSRSVATIPHALINGEQAGRAADPRSRARDEYDLAGKHRPAGRAFCRVRTHAS